MISRDIYRKVVQTVRPDTPVREAVDIMAKRGLNSLIVTNRGDTVAGLVTIVNLATATVPVGLQESAALAEAMTAPGYFESACKELAGKTVGDYMEAGIRTLPANADIMEVVAIFLNEQQHTVPIVDDAGVLLGIITRTEVRRALAETISKAAK